MMNLASDCKLVSLIPGWDSARNLRINSGVNIERRTLWEQASSACLPICDVCGVFTPKEDWRSLTTEELSALIGVTDSGDLASTVQLFEIGDELRRAGLLCTEAYLQSPSAEDKQKGFVPISETAARGFFDSFNDWVTENIYALSEEHSHQIVIAARLPGHLSSTGWGGLHVDIWGPSIQTQMLPGYMGSRLVVNLGDEKRQFIFTNVRLASMVRRHMEIFEAEHIKPLKDKLISGELSQRFIGDAFLEMYPDYPVISVILEPGQGYSAPTTSCLHDGYLTGMHGPDVALRTAHSGHPNDEASWSAPTYVHSWRERCFSSLRTTA